MTIKKRSLVIAVSIVIVVVAASLTVAGFALAKTTQPMPTPTTDANVSNADIPQEAAPADNAGDTAQTSGPLSGKKIYLLDSSYGIALSESSAAALASQAAEQGRSNSTIAVLINTGVDVVDTQTGATFVVRQNANGHVNLGSNTKVYNLEGITFEELQNIKFNQHDTGKTFTGDFGNFTFYNSH